MPINRLKPGHLAKLPPGTHGDGHGLALLVKPTGGRSWIQRLVIAGTGKRIAMGLGGYPIVSLADARAVALENRRKARKGEDPRKPRLPRFDKVAEMWTDDRAKKSWTERPLFEARMAKLVGPKIGRSTIDAVNAAGLREVVDGRSRSAKPRTPSARSGRCSPSRSPMAGGRTTRHQRYSAPSPARRSRTGSTWTMARCNPPLRGSLRGTGGADTASAEKPHMVLRGGKVSR